MSVAAHVGGGFFRRVASRRPAVIIAGAAATALAVNLALWSAGLVFGGSFQYTEADGSLHTTTAPQGVITMTVLPMSVGLALAALLAAAQRRVVLRRVVLRSAQAIGAGAALATTAPTFTAGFDTPSTIALGLMHVAVAALVVLALEALVRRPGTPSRVAGHPYRGGRGRPLSGPGGPPAP